MSYEFHGWFSMTAKEGVEDNLAPTLNDLRAPGFLINYGNSNGSFIASLNGCSNRDRNSDKLVRLFESVAQLDTKAIGALHVFDDERSQENVNYELNRGDFSAVDTNFLNEAW